jgi:GTP cyclohydrolase IA
MKESISTILKEIGEDPQREGLLKTPERVEKSMRFLTGGYSESTESIINEAMFKAENDEMIIVRDIEMYSLCEHHMLPFYGKVHVGYIPNKRIVGLSKIPRIVNMFARRLQVQERLTQQIADCLKEHLDPLGVMVVVEAKHFCSMMRGVEKQHSSMTTSAVIGAFRTDHITRQEFLTLISK